MEDKFLRIGKEAAIEAGKIISKYIGFKHQYKYKNKDKSDFATQADLEAEQKIIEIITKKLPQHSIIAEESGNVLTGSEYTWVIDPLDGTFSFSLGMPYFAVSVALLFKKQPILGVINHVSMGNLYYASKGKGAFLNGDNINVSQKNNLYDASMVVDMGHKKRREPKIDSYIIPLCRELGHIFSLGTTAVGLALSAQGVQDGMIAQAWIWDFAAGAVILQEAGGKLTDFEGKEIDWSKDRLNVVATNGLIHEEVLEVIK